MARKVIVIVGPTCSGKSCLALMIAEKLQTEIISADSRQIYKYLDIGTAKPPKEELKKIKHHFIDLFEPDADYNVSKFEKDSLLIIEQLLNRNKIPVVVGGSGLYVKAIVDGIFDTANVDEDFRNYLKNMREKHGNNYLYEQLKNLDPVGASQMLPQNWKRVIRALEVLHLTGKPIHEHLKEYHRNVNFDFIQIGLKWERNTLYKRIEKRVDKMIQAGLVEEVKNILSMGYSKELNSLNTVGYKEIISYLEGQISMDRTVELIKRNTRRFAKRQLTWFNADKRIIWYNVDDISDFPKLTNVILENLH
ncbi:tRNA (adenosine(37)-N6)-dimethylallyltransferase MiaA [Melioribacteraceae bacterium 4301-Me]|uniref:tRNA (adenosine(37)-N6)-dimethylallyltransferase MiaA n=1 Tax=Pyranulibacter aquaticus TaxID=3163344 RepID=UPI003596780E